MKLEKLIAGALKDTINMHGPITRDKIGSAVKRIIGSLDVDSKATESDFKQKDNRQKQTDSSTG